MSLKLFFSSSKILFFFGCSSAFLFIFFFFYSYRLRREPGREIFFKILGSHTFLFYLTYKFFLQFHYYSLYKNQIPITSWINWGLVMLTFLLFFISYLIRISPVIQAHRLSETVFPLFCAILPFGVYESPYWYHFQFIQESFLSWIFQPFYSSRQGFISISFIILGDLLIVAGMLTLKSAFSIFVQARVHLQHGIYRFIRHPLYLGESLTTIGFCLLSVSWFNIFLVILFIILQRIRASFEEKKLTSAFPGYLEYKKSTGLYFPKIL